MLQIYQLGGGDLHHVLGAAGNGGQVVPCIIQKWTALYILYCITLALKITLPPFISEDSKIYFVIYSYIWR
jgi:hypothetical protein